MISFGRFPPFPVAFGPLYYLPGGNDPDRKIGNLMALGV